ncbi:unnamed protein product [Cylindrotheca closterium]|uniref:Uncharacterized protein n=1 Tax=Cylindrotheca closterium TaxID=2856 RepID=A0AAD2CGF5_9STRA|nr:unnamed protein product [Cylindrotheca closterium]
MKVVQVLAVLFYMALGSSIATDAKHHHGERASVEGEQSHLRTKQQHGRHEHSEARDASSKNVVKTETHKTQQERFFDEDGFCGDTCEFCDAFGSLATATQKLQSKVAYPISLVLPFTSFASNVTTFRYEMAEKLLPIKHTLETIEVVVDNILPLVSAEPYIGTLMKTISVKLDILGLKLDVIVNDIPTLERNKNATTFLHNGLSTAKETIEYANIISSAANTTIGLVRTVGCSGCHQELTMSAVNVEKIEALSEKMYGMMDHFNLPAIPFELPKFDFNLDFLDEVKEKFSKFQDSMQDILDRTKKDIQTNYDFHKCCTPNVHYIATIGEVFSDMKDLITCVPNTGITGVIMAALNPLLKQVDMLFVDFNAAIAKLNVFGNQIVDLMNNVQVVPKFMNDISQIIDKSAALIAWNSSDSLAAWNALNASAAFNALNALVVFNSTTCNVGFADDIFSLSSICGEQRCTFPAIQPITFANKAAEPLSAIWESMQKECNRAWDDLKDIEEQTPCCEASRIALGAPPMGYPHGHSCAMSKTYICAYPHVCLGGAPGITSGTCQSGQVGSYCGRDVDCLDDAKCVLGSCRAGKVDDRCEFDSDCIDNKCVQLFCRSGKDGAKCELNSDCDSDRCEWWGHVGYCKAKLGYGSYCNEHADCQSNYCSWRFRCN